MATSLGLVGLLEGSFNDRLSQCLLAIADEVNEGGSQKYQASSKLRQLVTPELRDLNPKYGRKRVEHNAARWLIFSDHTRALPLDEKDRRLWAVNHEAVPRRGIGSAVQELVRNVRRRNADCFVRRIATTFDAADYLHSQSAYL